MTVFYGVDPSDVRKQTGDFGKVFKKTCAREKKEKMLKWSKALTDASNIAGEHFLKWDNEAKMIEKIAKDVLDKLNVTPSRDFEGMVGLEPHLMEIERLLDLDNDEVKMVAIAGPAGIGKTTIARALHSLLADSSRFNGFLSFHWPDVRVSFVSNLGKQFGRNEIVMFNDQAIESSQTIKPELSRAIQESRISIVVLSQNYASSSWCLNELVEILKCRETAGQIVMTVFYEVDPSYVLVYRVV